MTRRRCGGECPHRSHYTPRIIQCVRKAGRQPQAILNQSKLANCPIMTADINMTIPVASLDDDDDDDMPLGRIASSRSTVSRQAERNLAVTFSIRHRHPPSTCMAHAVALLQRLHAALSIPPRRAKLTPLLQRAPGAVPPCLLLPMRMPPMWLLLLRQAPTTVYCPRPSRPAHLLDAWPPLISIQPQPL